MFKSYEDMALFWVGYFEGRNRTKFIYPMENFEENVPIMNFNMVAVTFLDWWLGTGLTFDPWTMYGYYAEMLGYTTGDITDGEDAELPSTSLSVLEPIVPLYDPIVTRKCNKFKFKGSNWEWYDYVIVITSLICNFIGFLYFCCNLCETMEWCEEIVIFEFKGPRSKKALQKFLKFANITYCTCQSPDDSGGRRSLMRPSGGSRRSILRTSILAMNLNMNKNANNKHGSFNSGNGIGVPTASMMGHEPTCALFNEVQNSGRFQKHDSQLNKHLSKILTMKKSIRNWKHQESSVETVQESLSESDQNQK